MSDTAATDPAPDAPEPAPVPEVAPAAEGQEPAPEIEAPEFDGTKVQPEPEAPAPETVEIEVGGRKYLVPPDLRDGFMQHADYTQKSQKNAEFAKQLAEGQQALHQYAQTQRQNIEDYGELAHTDNLLEQFRNTDWNQAQQDDPEQAQQLSIQFQMLRDKREVIERRIQQWEHNTRVTAEREHANRKDQLKASLARDIPNYSPELHSKMDETAIRHGFTQAELDSVTDPKMMRMLHLAHLGEQVLQRKRAATAQPAPTPVKPVPKVSGGATPTTGPNSSQGINAWMRSREQQLKRHV